MPFRKSDLFYFYDSLSPYGSLRKSSLMRRHLGGIDTGAFASGVLTALAIEGTERWFLEARVSDEVTAAPDAR